MGAQTELDVDWRLCCSFGQVVPQFNYLHVQFMGGVIYSNCGENSCGDGSYSSHGDCSKVALRDHARVTSLAHKANKHTILYIWIPYNIAEW